MQRRRVVNLKQRVFLFLPLLPIRSRFRMCLFCHSTLVRLRRGLSRRHSSSSSSRSLRLQPHHLCYDCRHGLLVVLLVLCDTCSVCCCYTTRVIARVGMYLLHISTADVTIEISNFGVCALQALKMLVNCGAVALPTPERGYLHLRCQFRRAHCCCELRVAGRVRLVQNVTRTDVPVITPPAPFVLAIQA